MAEPKLSTANTAQVGTILSPSGVSRLILKGIVSYEFTVSSRLLGVQVLIEQDLVNVCTGSLLETECFAQMSKVWIATHQWVSFLIQNLSGGT